MFTSAALLGNKTVSLVGNGSKMRRVQTVEEVHVVKKHCDSMFFYHETCGLKTHLSHQKCTKTHVRQSTLSAGDVLPQQ